eukprot:15063214-Heterocapsa_arctica.AAC.1
MASGLPDSPVPPKTSKTKCLTKNTNYIRRLLRRVRTRATTTTTTTTTTTAIPSPQSGVLQYPVSNLGSSNTSLQI